VTQVSFFVALINTRLNLELKLVNMGQLFHESILEAMKAVLLVRND
jgi:hypothetical protein